MNVATHAASGSWAQQEFGAAQLVDKRLTKRLRMIAEDFYQQPNASIPQASGTPSRMKATYRFFANEDITVEQMLEAHRHRTRQRCADQPTVLMINDTSMLNFSTHPATQGLGQLRDKEMLGMLIHPTLAATPAGEPLGLADLQIWTRPLEDLGKRNSRHQRATPEKESHKWLTSYDAAVAFQAEHPDLRFVFIADRESDVFDLFELAQTAPASASRPSEASELQETNTAKRPELLIRAAQDRRVLENDSATESEDQIIQRLWETLEQQPLAGTYAIDIPPKDKQPAHRAELEIRFAQLTILPPRVRRRNISQLVTLWAIWAHEQNPPPGMEPISWMLLTTIAITSLEEALEKIVWYTRRWLIELLFKVLKSGCRFEDRQLETAERLQRCLVVDLVVAWRILYMTTVGRQQPDLPCTALFEDDEWKALYCVVNKTTQLPKAVPTLQAVVRMVAKLGGFLGRKHDGEPGVKTFWLGLHRLTDITTAWRLFNPQLKKSRKSCG